MEHLLKKLISIDDPFHSARLCYKFKQLNKHDLNILLNDEDFLFIHGNVIYFHQNIALAV